MARTHRSVYIGFERDLPRDELQRQHGHVLRRLRSLDRYIYYFYDAAGIELFTPSVLITLGILWAAIIFCIDQTGREYCQLQLTLSVHERTTGGFSYWNCLNSRLQAPAAGARWTATRKKGPVTRETAVEAIDLCKAVAELTTFFLDSALSRESDTEITKLKRAVGELLFTAQVNLLNPAIKEHPDTKPDELYPSSSGFEEDGND